MVYTAIVGQFPNRPTRPNLTTPPQSIIHQCVDNGLLRSTKNEKKHERTKNGMIQIQQEQKRLDKRAFIDLELVELGGIEPPTSTMPL